MAKNAHELNWTDVLNRFIFFIFSNLFRSPGALVHPYDQEDKRSSISLKTDDHIRFRFYKAGKYLLIIGNEKEDALKNIYLTNISKIPTHIAL